MYVYTPVDCIGVRVWRMYMFRNAHQGDMMLGTRVCTCVSACVILIHVLCECMRAVLHGSALVWLYCVRVSVWLVVLVHQLCMMLVYRAIISYICYVCVDGAVNYCAFIMVCVSHIYGWWCVTVVWIYVCMCLIVCSIAPWWYCIVCRMLQSWCHMLRVYDECAWFH